MLRVSAVRERPAATECCSQYCSGQRAAAAAELQRGGEQPALYIVITTATQPTAPAPHQPTTPTQPTSQTAVARVINI